MKPPSLGSVIWVLVFLGLAGGAGYWFVLGPGKKKEPEVRFETAAVDRGSITSKITATGTLSALVTVQVGSQVSGRVAEILADFNSQVTKGQVIARLDPQLFKAALEQAQANHAAARANLTRAEVQAMEAERQYKRTHSLAEQKFVPQAEADTAEANAQAARAQVEAARASVQQTKAQLNQAKVNLDYTTIHSPIDGVVISRNVDVGQTVAASLQAPTLFVIAEDLRRMQVDASVAEADVGKLRPGAEATFGVDAFPGEKFRGTIRQIRNAAQTVQNVVTYNAVIDVDNAELKLRPGMTASVTFVHAQRDGVLRVRNAALRFRPTPEVLASMGRAGPPGASGPAGTSGAPGTSPGGTSRPRAGTTGAPGGEKAADPSRRTVWVMRGEKPVSVDVRTGVTDGTATELLEGPLREGDRLVTDVSGSAAADPNPGGGPSGRNRPFRMF
jgi:HlyD family secretion protein